MNLVEAMNSEFPANREAICHLLGASDVQLVCHGTDFNIVADGRRVAEFSMDSLFGCSGLCVFYHSQIATRHRGKGLGKLLHTMRLDAVRRAGFGMVQCTTRADNAAQIRILEQNGWNRSAEFCNPRTGNNVLVWLKRL